MDSISGLAAAAIGSQGDMTANAVAISMLKQQSAMEQQLVQMIAESAQSAVLPPGQGGLLDVTV